jgi:hypothetical protein
VAIEGGVSDARPARDVVEARGCSIARENFLGYLKNALTVALRVGAGFAGRRGWGELLFRHMSGKRKKLSNGEYPRLFFIYSGTAPVLIRGRPDVNFDAAFQGVAPQQQEDDNACIRNGSDGIHWDRAG